VGGIPFSPGEGHKPLPGKMNFSIEMAF